FTALPLRAQTQIQTQIDPTKAAQVLRIAIPQPEIKDTTFEAINEPLFKPLTRDISMSGIFAIAPLPPNVPITPEVLQRINAQLLLKLAVRTEGEDFVVEARMTDTTGQTQFGKRYRGPVAALTRLAHMLASDLVRSLNGKPGPL